MNGSRAALAPSEHAMPFGLTTALKRSPLRDAISALTRTPEPDLLPGLVEQARLSAPQAAAVQSLALRIARGVREHSRAGGRAGLVQGLLQEFALSSQEGVALMCLAEALLRIPDADTRDALIRDKIGEGTGVDWQRHLGQSPSLFVNAAAWGLLLTGKLVSTHSDNGLAATLRRVVARGGEPLIRKGVDMAMRMMGEQFVTGETIEQALERAREREAQGFRYSYDMLGEAAMTAADAKRYFAAYENAIHAIGRASAGRGLVEGPGISIKLSALHPRYARAQVARVMAELSPRLTQLAVLARRYDIGLNIDAEESDRLELSLDLLEQLCFEPQLAGLERHRLRHPGLPEALPGRGRLPRRSGAPQRPPADGAFGQGRVLGQRDQARATRRPGRLPGLHPQALHRPRLHRLRPQTAGRTRRGVPAVRHAQRADLGDDPDPGRPRLARRAVRVPVPARHGRAAVRAGGRRRRAGPAVPHLRPGGHARNAAGLPGQAPAGKRRQLLVRQPHRRSRRPAGRPGRGSGANGRSHGGSRRRAGPASPGDRAAAPALRIRGHGPDQLARPGPGRRAHAGRTGPRLRGRRHHRHQPHALARRTDAGARRAAGRVDSPAQPRRCGRRGR